VSKDSSKLNVGDRIEISKVEYPSNRYVSQVLDVINDEEYIISGPIRRSTLIYMKENTVIEILYFKKEIGKFVFKALITGIWEKGLYKLRIKKISDIIKIQERNFFRLPISLEVHTKYEVKNKNEEIIIEETCKTGDISGGGMKLFSNYNYKKNAQLLLTFTINDLELNVLGEVVRASEIDSNDFKYEIGLKFIGIDNSQRDAIIRYIFEQQRELRKKGLI